MKKKIILLLTLLLCLFLGVLLIINYSELQKSKFTVEVSNGNTSNAIISVNNIFNINVLDSIDINVTFPAYLTKWKDLDDELLYENPKVIVKNGEILSGVTYVTFNKDREIMTIFYDLGLKKGSIGYLLLVDQKIDLVKMEVKSTLVEIKKMKR